ncbi:MFS Git1p-related glycerophosphoinositol and glycerophosphocholine permease [Neolentinus lepideus HHB14362 ss-1]|uniref:MFS Git1p-related glycerophosphoinositol and glycerophosphocholine permease n=1 Tax=Neolentinus lepideus HHB14362 ss-1 TaxID=1314782 RepID=A0A165VQB3_9AGAM|nr:MFS Git1p-related glycerophosphoinositol and glycerophosphocholine permease [Neolentinus lepideus HHB14362 ss-1]
MSNIVRNAGLSQVSLIFACGTATFSDGYTNNVIGSANTLITRIYGEKAVSQHSYNTTVSSMAFAGTVVGIILFGYLSDKVGRKFGMMTATCIIAIFSALSAVSIGAHHSLGGMLYMLSACRFLLGIGVGAEYPCGAVAAAEQSEQPGIERNAQHRWFVLATNTMTDWGTVAGAFVPLVLYWIFGPHNLHAVWRFSLGLGAIPALAVLVWRLRMEEPERYKEYSMRKCKIPYTLVIKRYWKNLAPICATWFIHNFIVYPFNIFSSTIINTVTGGSTSLSTVFGWNVVINLFYIPGTMGGAFIVDYIGPKRCQILGLLSQAVIGFIMSGLYVQLSHHIAAFAVVYGIFLSLGEIGPGNCSGLSASKTSPTAVRGQFYCIAAAVGKVGAFVGTWAFPAIISDFGSGTVSDTGPFWIGSGLAVLSAAITYFWIKPVTHDGLVLEDRLFREYLEENGYDTSQMGIVGRQVKALP